MNIDIIYVTYNSEKWINSCFEAWKSVDESKDINIIVVDNASTDRSLELLKSQQRKMKSVFTSFQIIPVESNGGFGQGNNIGFRHGKSEFVGFFNIDTEVQKDTIANLCAYIRQAQEKDAMWELRQMPYEHPKYYDPVTGQTGWCSGAAFVVRRKVYENVGGFDEHFFMYAEDVDLSWRIRNCGHNIIYCPRAAIIHKTYDFEGEVKPIQYGYSMRNNILMRYRYGTIKDIFEGYILFLKLLFSNKSGFKFNIRFLRIVMGHLRLIPYFKKKIKGQVGEFRGLDYAKKRYGAFYKYRKSQDINIVVFRIDGDHRSKSDVKVNLDDQINLPLKVEKCEIGQIVESLKNIVDKDKLWISIIDGHKMFFADHYETMAGAVTLNREVIGTVNNKGIMPADINYYLISYDFLMENVSDIEEGIVKWAEKCAKAALLVKKQTVCE